MRNAKIFFVCAAILFLANMLYGQDVVDQPGTKVMDAVMLHQKIETETTVFGSSTAGQTAIASYVPPTPEQPVMTYYFYKFRGTGFPWVAGDEYVIYADVDADGNPSSKPKIIARIAYDAGDLTSALESFAGTKWIVGIANEK